MSDIKIGDRVRIKSEGDTNPVGHEVIGVYLSLGETFFWLRWWGGWGFETVTADKVEPFQ